MIASTNENRNRTEDPPATQGDPCDGLPMTPVDAERGRVACTPQQTTGRGVDEAFVRIDRSDRGGAK